MGVEVIPREPLTPSLTPTRSFIFKGEAMKRPKFIIYATSPAHWRWRLTGANGEIVAIGEAYDNKSNCERAVRDIRRLSAVAKVTDEDLY